MEELKEIGENTFIIQASLTSLKNLQEKADTVNKLIQSEMEQNRDLTPEERRLRIKKEIEVITLQVKDKASMKTFSDFLYGWLTGFLINIEKKLMGEQQLQQEKQNSIPQEDNSEVIKEEKNNNEKSKPLLASNYSQNDNLSYTLDESDRLSWRSSTSSSSSSSTININDMKKWNSDGHSNTSSIPNPTLDNPHLMTSSKKKKKISTYPESITSLSSPSPQPFSSTSTSVYTQFHSDAETDTTLTNNRQNYSKSHYPTSSISSTKTLIIEEKGRDKGKNRENKKSDILKEEEVCHCYDNYQDNDYCHCQHSNNHLEGEKKGWNGCSNLLHKPILSEPLQEEEEKEVDMNKNQENKIIMTSEQKEKVEEESTLEVHDLFTFLEEVNRLLTLYISIKKKERDEQDSKITEIKNNQGMEKNSIIV